MSLIDAIGEGFLVGVCLTAVILMSSVPAEGQQVGDIDTYLSTKTHLRKEGTKVYAPSPLIGKGIVFVESANCVDPRVMVGIGGHESVFAVSPSGTFNAFGVKKYDAKGNWVWRNYTSWEEGIADASDQTEGMIFRWSLITLHGLSHVYCGGPLSSEEEWKKDKCESWEGETSNKGGVGDYYAEQLREEHFSSEALEKQVHVLTYRSCLRNGRRATPPCLSKASLTFDPQKLGSTIEKNAVEKFTVVNCSLHPLDMSVHIADDTSNSFSFVLGQLLQFHLDPEGRKVVSLKFSPHEIGAARANVVVVGGGQKSIRMTGEAVTAHLDLPSDVNFGSVLANTTVERNLNIVNTGCASTGDIAVTVDDKSGFQVKKVDAFSLKSAESRDFVISYSPTKDGIAEGSLIVTDTEGESVTVRLHAVAIIPRLELAPADGAFGKVRIGDSPGMLRVTVINQGGAIARNFTPVIVNNSEGAFSIKESELPNELGPGQELRLTLLFSPKTEGQKIGQLSLKCGDCNAFDFPLIGEGTAAHLELSKISGLDFGRQKRGTKINEGIVLSNAGSADLEVIAVQVSGNAFQLSNPWKPHTLSSKGQETIQITFNPTKSATCKGVLNIESNDLTGPKSVSLLGVGTRRFTISILWSWIGPQVC